MSRHLLQSYTRMVHECLAATYHRNFWQNDLDLTCCCGNTKIQQMPVQKVDPREEDSPAAPAGTRTRDLLITSSHFQIIFGSGCVLPNFEFLSYIF